MGRAVGGRAAALLLAGRTVSRFGSSFYLVALPLYVLERTGSLGASGLFFTLTSLPPLLAVPFLGPLVERAHRKGLLILCDFGASALCALLLLFPGPPLPFLLAGTMLFHLLSHLFEIASKVLFSELCPPERLSSLNGIKSLLDHGAAVLALRRARFCLDCVDSGPSSCCARWPTASPPSRSASFPTRRAPSSRRNRPACGPVFDICWAGGNCSPSFFW